VDAAKEASASAPMLGAVRQRMGEAVDAGMGARDWSAMADFTMTRPGR
jgi:3-hydroxyisobutyrate dehydrogenase-like beta-hydroxyacid dehydrogenase